MRKLHVLMVGVGLLAFLSSCKDTGKTGSADGAAGDTVRFKYATLLTVVRYADHTHVEIKNPWKPGHVLRQYDVPAAFRRVVVTTTSHCQLLCDLGAQSQIKGVCDAGYIHVDAIRHGLRQGRITDCGNGISPEIEKLVDIGADAVIVSPFENSGGYGRLETLNIPIIEAADYMESTALARAEWMRLYGILFGKEREADSLFHVVDSTYHMLVKEAGRMPQGRSVLTERKTGGVWYCPGGRSTMGKLIGDAHGAYAFADDSHSGSLALPFEQVLDHAGNADVWLLVAAGQPLPTRQTLLTEYHGYKGLKAYRTREIYVCDASTSHYFEEVPFRPDYLLRDFIQLFHPGISFGNLRYYQKIE